MDKYTCKQKCKMLRHKNDFWEDGFVKLPFITDQNTCMQNVEYSFLNGSIYCKQKSEMSALNHFKVGIPHFACGYIGPF